MKLCRDDRRDKYIKVAKQDWDEMCVDYELHLL